MGKWIRSSFLVLLAFLLVAPPAVARPWRDHPRHGDRHPGYHRGHAFGRHLHAPARGHHRHAYRHRAHRAHRGDDVWLWLGVAAVGVTALWALTQHQRGLHAGAWGDAYTAPVGRTIPWSDGPASGAVTPVSEGIADDGAYCREFQQEIRVGGRSERGYGTACLQPDGSWQVVP